MRKLLELLRVELSNTHIWNETDNQKKADYIIMIAFIGIVSTISYAFFNGDVERNIKFGSPYLVFVSIQLAVAYDTLLRVKDILYSYDNYLLVCHMPIKQGHIVISKMLSMTMSSLKWEMMLGIPFLVVYSFQMRQSTIFFISYTICLISGAFITSMVICFIFAIIVKRNDNNIVQIVFYGTEFLTCFLAIGVLGYLGFYESVEGKAKIVLIVSILLLLASAVIFLSLYHYISFNYSVNIASYAERVSNDISSIHIGSVKRGKIRNLIVKELMTFINIRLYMINTLGFPVVFSMSLVIAYLFKDALELHMESLSFMDRIVQVAPIVVSTIMGMSCSTYCSFSLEGNHIYTLRSMPISFAEVVLSKIIFYIGVMSPFIIINGITMNMLLYNEIDMMQKILIFVLPLICSVLMGTFGILMDMLLGSFMWINHISVIKQGVALPITMLACVFFNSLPAVSILFFHLDSSSVYTGTIGIWILSLLITVVAIMKTCREKKYW